MRILAVDTSSERGSVCITDNDAVLGEIRLASSVQHAERLFRSVDFLLASLPITLADIDLFVASRGPGSFTGLRVGIATIQGLAFAQKKRVVPVSSFEALVFQTSDLQPPPSAATAAWIDAHRGEVFAALYDADGRELAAPTALKPDATLDAWSPALAPFNRIRFVGDGAALYRDRIAARVGEHATIDAEPTPLAGRIGLIAAAAAAAARAVVPHAVVPLYIRRPDAVLARERRDAASKP
jgi:tRNA threonylcarbamoyladenosine biosynthesis protein TsaB